MRTAFILVMSALLTPWAAQADGGTIRLREASGPFLVTVFTSPEQPRSGPVDTSVLVQERETGSVILDATVNLVFQPVAGLGPQLSSRATRGQAKNKLLLAATIDVPAPGWWAVQVFVRRGGEEAVLITKLLVLPAAPRLATIWPFLIFPPFAIGLFAFDQRRRGTSLPKDRRPCTR
jgi:hypothetical protein